MASVSPLIEHDAHRAPAPLRVALVARPGLARAAVERVLADTPGVRTAVTVDDFEMLLRRAPEPPPTLVVVDPVPPYLSLADGAEKLARRHPGVPVLALISPEDIVLPGLFARTPVTGFLTKHCDPPELAAAITAVGDGERYISADLAQRMAVAGLEARASAIGALTRRELQLLVLLAEGRRIEAIAATLKLTPKTVNAYRHRLLERLGLDTDVQLLHLALRHRLIPSCLS